MGFKYSDLVDYARLDPVKKMAMEIFASTFAHSERLSVRVVSIGETAAVLDFLNYDFMLAFNVEGLGTKNLIADEMHLKSKLMGSVDVGRYYRYLGQDALAMSVTDLIAVGADPIAYVDAIASGDSRWFDDEERARELLRGYKLAADRAGCAIPQGETPTLPGIVLPGTLDLVGSSVGIIRPKQRFTNGQKITGGDVVFGMSSGGICANGVSKARAIASKLKEGYFTRLPTGKTLGEELLRPTPIYVKPIMEMYDSGVNIHYISPITGHGWRKIARARFPFTYRVEHVPDPPSIFSVLIEWGKDLGFDVSDEENYQVWNMGVFIVLIAPREDQDRITQISEKHGADVYTLGYVEEGDRQVVMKSKGFVYKV